jgi:hypothetical protein
MKKVEIPETWTGKEAMLVYGFLADVMEEIWEHHSDQMVDIWLQAEDEPTDQIDWIQSEGCYDEIPF